MQMQMQMQMQESPLLRNSPSSTSFSNSLAGIADRVVNELRIEESQLEAAESYDWVITNNSVDFAHEDENHEVDGEVAEEFEFSLVQESSPIISADEIFYDGKIRSVYTKPYSFSNAVDADSLVSTLSELKLPRQQLRQLRDLIEDDPDSPRTSSSSSGADDLDGLSPGTYCVWTPKGKTNGDTAEPTPRKSVSNGSLLKRWSIRDLLYLKSHSDGKETFVFLTRIKKIEKLNSESKVKGEFASSFVNRFKIYRRDTGKIATVTVKDGAFPKRRTYLPYRVFI